MTSVPRRPPPLAIAVVALAVAAATLLQPASGAADGSRAFSASAPPARLAGGTVRIRNFKFRPHSLTVGAGTTIIFANKDHSRHTATDAGVFNTHRIRPGKSKSVVLSTPGTYDYVCRIHPYMTGTIVVH